MVVQKNCHRFSLERRRRLWACAHFNSYYESRRRASSSDTLKSPMSTLTPSKSARILATGLPRSVQVDHAPHVVVIAESSTGMMATVVRLPGRSSRRVFCISLYIFVLNRFPCSIILGMLLRTHDFNSSQFATRHPAEGVGFLSLSLGGDGRGAWIGTGRRVETSRDPWDVALGVCDELLPHHSCVKL